MPLYTAISQEGTISTEHQGKNRIRDHPNSHFCDESAEELCPRGLSLVSSGMTAGTKLNSYHTVTSMNVLLRSGTLIDTGSVVVDGQLFEHEHELRGLRIQMWVL
jgi:hypothetical protein